MKIIQKVLGRVNRDKVVVMEAPEEKRILKGGTEAITPQQISRYENQKAKEAAEIEQAYKQFTLSTATINELFNQLKKKCLGGVAVVLTIGAGNQQHFIYRAWGPDYIVAIARERALDTTRARIRVEEREEQESPRFVCLSSHKHAEHMATKPIVAELERRGLASYIVTVSNNSWVERGGNAFGTFETVLCDVIKRNAGNLCGGNECV